MEPLFIIQTHFNKKNIWQAYSRFWWQPRFRWGYHGIFLGAIMVSLLIIFLYYHSLTIIVNTVLLGCLGGILRYLYSLNKYYRSALTVAPTGKIISHFFEERFGEKKYLYSSIKQILNSKKFLIFVFAGGLMFFEKNGFIKGDYEEFKKFIEQKCPKAIQNYR